MKNIHLINEKKVIDQLFSDINSFSGDPYFKSMLTYYLCIRVSGFLQNCIRIIYTEYSNPRIKDHVVTFMSNKLKMFPNPTWDSILKLSKEFNPDWKSRLQLAVTAKTRTALESVNNNRNAIAHGGTSSITLSDLQKYYLDLLTLVDDVEKIAI